MRFCRYDFSSAALLVVFITLADVVAAQPVAAQRPEAGSERQSKKSPAQAGRGKSVSVTNVLRVHVTGKAVQFDASMEYRVLGGELSELQIAIPVDHRILDISSTDARFESWTSVLQKGRKLATVKLRGNLTDKMTVEVHTEAELPDGDFQLAGLDKSQQIHGIHAIAPHAERGFLIVTHDESIAISVQPQGGAQHVAQAQVPQSLHRPGAKYYRYFNRGIRLQARARRLEALIRAQQATTFVFRNDGLKVQSDLTYTIKRAGVSELRLRVPEELVVEKVDCPEMTEFHLDEETSVLSVILDGRRKGTVRVSITAFGEILPPGEEELPPLPLIVPLDTKHETGHVYLFAPASLDLSTDADLLVGARESSAAGASTIPNARLVSAWSYFERPVEIYALVKPKPTWLRARAATTIRALTDRVEVDTTLDVQVQQGGLNRFHVALPLALAESVRIRASTPQTQTAIRQVIRGDEADDAGWITWTIVMQREVAGRQTFEIRYSVPTQSDSAANTSTADVPIVRLLDSDPIEDDPDAPRVSISIAGEIRVVEGQKLYVSTEAGGDEVEPMAVDRLEQLPRKGRSAYRYRKQPVELKLTIGKPLHTETVEAYISRALVEVAVGDAGNEAVYHCRYRMESIRLRRLPIELPKGAEILAVLLNGTPVGFEKRSVQTEQGWQPYFIPIGDAHRAGKPLQLALRFRVPIVPPAFASQGGKLQLALPRFGERDASSAHGETSIRVEQTRVTLFTPKEFALWSPDAPFIRESRVRFGRLLFGRRRPLRETGTSDDWVENNEAAEGSFPMYGRGEWFSTLESADRFVVSWWKMSFLTWVLSGTLVLIAVVLRKTSVRNKLFVLLVAALGVAVLRIENHEAAVYGVFAARYGIPALCGYWLIYSCSSCCRGQQVKPTAQLKTDVATVPSSATSDAPSKTDKPMPPPDDEKSNDFPQKT